MKLTNLLNTESILSESSSDKGLFKSIFFAGIPGAGKTYTIKKVTDGSINPRVVSFDKMAEFWMKNKSFPAEKVKDMQDVFRDEIKKSTISELSNYINGMLPLFIDGTSNSVSTLFRREGIIKSFGYDTGMIWINTDLDVAIERAKKRERPVPEDFIVKIHKDLELNIPYYKSHFSFFVEIKNNDGELDDKSIMEAYKKVSSFYSSPIQNPVGVRNLEKAKQSGYLVPNVYKSVDEIKQKTQGWY